MCRTSSGSPGSSCARGPSERGSMEVWGGPSMSPRASPFPAAGIQSLAMAASGPNPLVKVSSACLMAP
eukprot:14360137-Heterocapsa_arctica.AAC.1